MQYFILAFPSVTDNLFVLCVAVTAAEFFHSGDFLNHSPTHSTENFNHVLFELGDFFLSSVSFSLSVSRNIVLMLIDGFISSE